MNKQNNLILILIIVVGLAGGYLYYSQFGSLNLPEIPPPPTPAGKDTLLQFQNLSVNLSILSNPAYSALGTFGESPVNPGPTGKKDIFAPF